MISPGRVLGVLSLGVALSGAAAAVSCASPSRFAGSDPADACAAARSGQAPFQGADLERGARVFASECSECHGFGPAGSHRGRGRGAARLPGPDLQGVVSRPIGSLKSFSYSAAFDGRHDERWTLVALDAYVEDPSWFVPGTRMSYSGLADGDERLDLLAYLSCDGAPGAPH